MADTGRPNSTEQDSTRTLRWQREARPWMKVLVTTVLVFFLVVTGWQIYSLHQRIEEGPQVTLASESVEATTTEELRWADLISLEAHCIQQRYHQANMVLMTRIWMAYLGFVTGMILCIVGAVFVIGKMREPQTDIKVETEGLATAIKSSSPGIIMAVLGTALILTTLLTRHEINVTDSALYIGGTVQSFGVSSDQSVELPPPVDPFGGMSGGGGVSGQGGQ